MKRALSKADSLPLILASQSRARQAMLKNVGLKFEAIPANIDEEKLTEKMIQQNAAPSQIALELAKQKALAISQQDSVSHESYIIGADQILECDGQLLSKANNEDQARAKLEFLSGKTHRLISAISIVQNGAQIFSTSDEARLTMKKCDDIFLDEYCAQAGPALIRSVGAYELESHGAWLFEKIEGDFFTILGLPLLKLLKWFEGQDR